jgi:hypothetical protein
MKEYKERTKRRHQQPPKEEQKEKRQLEKEIKPQIPIYLPNTNFSTHDGAIVPFFWVVLNDSALISLPPRSTNVNERNGSDVPLRAHGIKFLASTISTVSNLFFGRPDGEPLVELSSDAFLPPNIFTDYKTFSVS